MAYTTQNAKAALDRYLGLQESDKRYIENTANRGFVLTLPNDEEVVIFIYPLVHKQDNTKNYFDTRDSGAYERGVAWNYALAHGLKYFCLGVNDSVDKYQDYVFSLECNDATVEQLSGTKDGRRDGPGNQIIIPNDYIPSKPFHRFKNRIGTFICAVHKDRLYSYLEQADNRPYLVDVTPVDLGERESEASAQAFSPEWFKEKAADYPTLDAEAEQLLVKFQERFSPDYLESLSGREILDNIFLNTNNADNLCRVLEFDPAIKDLFGSIKGGNAFKYGLFFSSKGCWMTGSHQKPRPLTEEEAIEIGSKIRDHLVAGARAISAFGAIEKLADYRELYTILHEATKGDINRVWFLKYYQMLYPAYFATNYSDYAQRCVLTAIGEEREEYPLVRMGQIRLYADKCEISNVMFSKIFWDYYAEEEDAPAEEIAAPQLRIPVGLKSEYSRNRILFGAPGTGKSHTLEDDRKKLLKDGGEYERVTFHPDYSYANFVGTYKPVPFTDANGNEGITYTYVPGPFMRIYKKALENSRTDTPKPYLLIIEEINRANVAAVFGDVFQLLDRTADEISQYPVQASEDMKKYLADQLGESISAFEEIRIPDNMFIWASMNSADQGVFPLDTAFKRRWDFTYLGIDDSEEKVVGKKVILGEGTYRRIVEWNELRKAINEELLTYKVNEDKLLGPYFLSPRFLPEGEMFDEKTFKTVFKNKVIMYLFDDAAKQRRGTLFDGCGEKSKTQYSKICSEFEQKGVFIFCDRISSQFSEVPTEGE